MYVESLQGLEVHHLSGMQLRSVVDALVDMQGGASYGEGEAVS